MSSGSCADSCEQLAICFHSHSRQLWEQTSSFPMQDLPLSVGHAVVALALWSHQTEGLHAVALPPDKYKRESTETGFGEQLI